MRRKKIDLRDFYGGKIDDLIEENSFIYSFKLRKNFLEMSNHLFKIEFKSDTCLNNLFQFILFHKKKLIERD
jgi:hypothetical protein